MEDAIKTIMVILLLWGGLYAISQQEVTKDEYEEVAGLIERVPAVKSKVDLAMNDNQISRVEYENILKQGGREQVK